MNNELTASNFRKWREACNLTQQEAANRLAASVDTIRSIESGRLALSNRMTLACEAVSGCVYVSFRSQHGPRGADGRPFSHKHFQAHRDARAEAVRLSKRELQPA